MNRAARRRPHSIDRGLVAAASFFWLLGLGLAGGIIIQGERHDWDLGAAFVRNDGSHYGKLWSWIVPGSMVAFLLLGVAAFLTVLALRSRRPR